MLAPTGNLEDWKGAQVAEPGAVVYNDKIYLYFTAVGLRPDGKKPQAKSTIGLAMSDDGYTFGPPVRVLEQGALYPAEQGYLGYSTPAALVMDGEVHMFHDVAVWFEDEEPGYVQVALYHAVSPDGVSGWVSDDNPIFTRNSFEWTQRELRAPTVIRDGDELKMWFAGDDFLAKRTWGIGYAVGEVESL